MLHYSLSYPYSQEPPPVKIIPQLSKTVEEWYYSSVKSSYRSEVGKLFL